MTTYTATYRSTEGVRNITTKMHSEQVVGFQILALVLFGEKDHFQVTTSDGPVALDRSMYMVEGYRNLEHAADNEPQFRYLYALSGGYIAGSYDPRGYLLDGIITAAELFQVNWRNYVHQIYDLERKAYIPVMAIQA